MVDAAKVIQLFEDRKLTCCKCKEDKHVSEFTKNNGKKRGFSYKCRQCISFGRRTGKREFTPERLKLISDYTKNRHAKIRNERLLLIEKTGRIICTKCKNARVLSDYQKDSSRWSGYKSQCRDCANPRQNSSYRNWYQANKDHMWWKKKFHAHGITKDRYLDMMAAQNGCCAICKGQPRKFLRVDHNHKTKEIRGLLCEGCNSGIGFFKDNPLVCKNAAEYLEKRGYYGNA